MGAPIVLIMGPPGAGKGTQASHIVDAYGLKHVSTGDVFRAHKAQGTELENKALQGAGAASLVGCAHGGSQTSAQPETTPACRPSST